MERPITKDLTVTYSQDLSTSRQKVISIEYFVSSNTSIIATKEFGEIDRLSMDIKFRKRIK